MNPKIQVCLAIAKMDPKTENYSLFTDTCNADPEVSSHRDYKKTLLEATDTYLKEDQCKLIVGTQNQKFDRFLDITERGVMQDGTHFQIGCYSNKLAGGFGLLLRIGAALSVCGAGFTYREVISTAIKGALTGVGAKAAKDSLDGLESTIDARQAASSGIQSHDGPIETNPTMLMALATYFADSKADADNESDNRKCRSYPLARLNFRSSGDNDMLFPHQTQIAFKATQTPPLLEGVLLNNPIKLKMMTNEGDKVDVAFVEMPIEKLLPILEKFDINPAFYTIFQYVQEIKRLKHSLIVAIACGKPQGFMLGAMETSYPGNKFWAAVRMINFFKQEPQGISNLASAFHAIRLLGIQRSFPGEWTDLLQTNAAIKYIDPRLLSTLRRKFETAAQYSKDFITWGEFTRMNHNIPKVDLRPSRFR